MVELTDGNFNVQSRSMMQAITALCPGLKEVRFHSYNVLQDAGDSLLSLQELRSLLSSSSDPHTSCWPRVYIAFVNSKYSFDMDFISFRCRRLVCVAFLHPSVRLF